MMSKFLRGGCRGGLRFADPRYARCAHIVHHSQTRLISASRGFRPIALISAASRVGGRRSDHWTEDRAMPLTTDKKLLALSREVIEAFDKANGDVHGGFRPAHAKG